MPSRSGASTLASGHAIVFVAIFELKVLMAEGVPSLRLVLDN